MKYAEAYEELQEILEKLQSDEVSIDELEKHVKRASILLKKCQDKLRVVEKDIESLLSKEED